MKFKRKAQTLEDIIFNLSDTLQQLDMYSALSLAKANEKKEEADKLLFEVQDLDASSKRAAAISNNIAKLLEVSDE